MPHSTNSWENTIEANQSGGMIPAETLSGNLTIETLFYNQDNLVSVTKLRVFYV